MGRPTDQSILLNQSFFLSMVQQPTNHNSQSNPIQSNPVLRYRRTSMSPPQRGAIMAVHAAASNQRRFAVPPPVVPSVRIVPPGQAPSTTTTTTTTNTTTTTPHEQQEHNDNNDDNDNNSNMSDEEYFPVHRIYCVGRNYAEHAREMGGHPDREPPFFFTKPPDAIVDCCPWRSFGSNHQKKSSSSSSESSSPAAAAALPAAPLLLLPTVPYPLATRDCHHEIELVVAIGGKGGTHIPTEQALDHVFGYAVGVDLTRRDLQAEAKKHGRPWDSAKAFDQSAPMSSILPVHRIETTSQTDNDSADNLQNSQIWLNVNGERRQTGSIHQMIWSIPEIISNLSHQFHLVAGDLIFTGTPSGVGPLERGDLVEGGVERVGQIQFRVE